MNRREFIGAAAAFSLPGQTAASKPNFLFILADRPSLSQLLAVVLDHVPHIDRATEGPAVTPVKAPADTNRRTSCLDD